ncbi:Ca2+/Na+ antiporter [Dehalogenimonas lykanthroporepellens BL-DC-9]|nr:Ca2+/Na+ antiporter [Dehalogenimonas lykanthroporepellens BL-DC-9]
MKNAMKYWIRTAVVAVGTVLTMTGFITGFVWLVLTGAVLAVCGFISIIVAVVRDKSMLGVDTQDLRLGFKPGFMPRLWLLAAGLILNSIAIETGFLFAALGGLVLTLLGVGLLLKLFLTKG